MIDSLRRIGAGIGIDDDDDDDGGGGEFGPRWVRYSHRRLVIEKLRYSKLTNLVITFSRGSDTMMEPTDVASILNGIELVASENTEHLMRAQERASERTTRPTRPPLSRLCSVHRCGNDLRALCFSSKSQLLERFMQSRRVALVKGFPTEPGSSTLKVPKSPPLRLAGLHCCAI